MPTLFSLQPIIQTYRSGSPSRNPAFPCPFLEQLPPPQSHFPMYKSHPHQVNLRMMFSLSPYLPPSCLISPLLSYSLLFLLRSQPYSLTCLFSQLLPETRHPFKCPYFGLSVLFPCHEVRVRSLNPRLANVPLPNFRRSSPRRPQMRFCRLLLFPFLLPVFFFLTQIQAIS